MFSKKLKILGMVGALTAFIAVASVVYAGLNWTGIDPEIELPDGSALNIWIAVPPGTWCSIDGDIEVKVRAPHGSTLVSESNDVMDGCEVGTVTTIKERSNTNKVKVTVKIKLEEGAPEAPAQVMVEQNGEEIKTCDGETDKKIKCVAPIEM